MDEAFSRTLQKPVPIALAATLCLDGADPHDYKCADERCDAPVQAASFKPANIREPYFATCKQITCHDDHCHCKGKDAATPIVCHHSLCEYVERTASLESGKGKVAKAAELTLVTPTEFVIRLPEEMRGGGRGPSREHRIRMEGGSFTLFSLVTWLTIWQPDEAVRLQLRFGDRTMPIGQWFRRPQDFVATDARACEDAVSGCESISGSRRLSQSSLSEERCACSSATFPGADKLGRFRYLPTSRNLMLRASGNGSRTCSPILPRAVRPIDASHSFSGRSETRTRSF